MLYNSTYVLTVTVVMHACKQSPRCCGAAQLVDPGQPCVPKTLQKPLLQNLFSFSMCLWITASVHVLQQNWLTDHFCYDAQQSVRAHMCVVYWFALPNLSSLSFELFSGFHGESVSDCLHDVCACSAPSMSFGLALAFSLQFVSVAPDNLTLATNLILSLATGQDVRIHRSRSKPVS